MSNATSRGPKGGPRGPRGAKKALTGTQKGQNLPQKVPDWSPEGVQNVTKIVLKLYLKRDRFPKSILRVVWMDFRVDSDDKNTRKPWRGHQNQVFRILIPDITSGQFLGRFWVQIWVNFGPKIDPALIQKLSGSMWAFQEWQTNLLESQL